MDLKELRDRALEATMRLFVDRDGILPDQEGEEWEAEYRRQYDLAKRHAPEPQQLGRYYDTAPPKIGPPAVGHAVRHPSPLNRRLQLGCRGLQLEFTPVVEKPLSQLRRSGFARVGSSSQF